jgi:hypothetical protein
MNKVWGLLVCQFEDKQTSNSKLTNGSSAGVAQSVEQGFCKPQVVGSIPSSSFESSELRVWSLEKKLFCL